MLSFIIKHFKHAKMRNLAKSLFYISFLYIWVSDHDVERICLSKLCSWSIVAELWNLAVNLIFFWHWFVLSSCSL